MQNYGVNEGAGTIFTATKKVPFSRFEEEAMARHVARLLTKATVTVLLKVLFQWLRNLVEGVQKWTPSFFLRCIGEVIQTNIDFQRVS